MLDKETIEANKEKLNLAPNLEFVARHMKNYQNALEALYNRPVKEQGSKLASSLIFDNSDSIIQPQVNPDEIRKIISVMPDSLARLSKLEKIFYFNQVPVPGFDDEGNFDNKKIQLVNYSEFPRVGDHPSRILVGYSTGDEIWPTPIPRTVSTDDGAVKAYQNHVFLHEFFHTVESLRRDDAKRRAVLLECDGKKFTLQDFWQSFENLYVEQHRAPVSRYAATYSDKLNKEMKIKDPKNFSSAIGEQICESFVGYMLGILPNDQGIVDFKSSHPQEHRLIDKIYRAKVLSVD
jgi:hypothetical protein